MGTQWGGGWAATAPLPAWIPAPRVRPLACPPWWHSKTTLLDCWAGRKTFGQLSGEVLYDGEPPTPALLRRHGEARGAGPGGGCAALQPSCLGPRAAAMTWRHPCTGAAVGYVEQRDTLLPMLTPFEVRPPPLWQRLPTRSS